VHERREALPYLKDPTFKVGIWEIVKNNIGKDLSKMTMPVHINEPMGMLQILSQVMEYPELLLKADECDDPIQRLLYVGAFNVALLSCTH